MEWRPGTAALPGLSTHDGFETHDNFGLRRPCGPPRENFGPNVVFHSPTPRTRLQSSAVELREFAERIVFGTSLAEKLADPGPLTDTRPGPALASPTEPGRPEHLRFKARQGSGEDSGFPGMRGLDTDVGRGRVLHFFANHELLAVELMALALLRFPDAPPAFRMGLLHTLRDEQRHTQDYLRRMQACGVTFGELPVSGHLWRLLAPMASPLDYVSGLPLTFEQANLDHSLAFGRAFAEAGDGETAALLRSIHRDEIAHVAHGLKWFRRWKDPGLADWEAFRTQLQFPLSPSRAKGPAVDEASRRAAGLDDAFIRQLRVHGQSRGRAPAVHWFNPFAEHAVAGHGMESLPAVRRDLARDLDTLPVGLVRQDDVVLVHEEPSLEFRESLRAAGLPVPEFDVLVGGRIRPGSNLLARAIGELRPWAWGPDSMECLGPLAGRLPPGAHRPPACMTPERAATFSKPWSAAFLRRWLAATPAADWLCTADEVGAVVHSMAEARDAIASIRGRGHHRIVAKAALDLAGAGQLRLWEDEVLPAQWRWLESQVDHPSGLVIEPWLERVVDFSVQIDVSACEGGRGQAEIVGYAGMEADLRGQFVSNWAEPAFHRRPPVAVERCFTGIPDISRRLRGHFAELIQALGQALREAGHRGPAGIDAFVYRDAAGRARLKPMVEVNPRHTFGRLTLSLMRHAAQGTRGVLRVVGRRELRASGEPSFAALAARLRRAGPLVRTDGPAPRIERGWLCLNDPAKAQSFLATFEVSPAHGGLGRDTTSLRRETPPTTPES